MSEMKYSLNEMQTLINEQIKNPTEDTEVPELDEEKILAVSLSPETTLKHIATMVGIVQNRLKKSPNNIMMMQMALRLFDLQCKIAGMFNIKPDIQGLIDAEINTYKQKVITIIMNIADKDITNKVIDELTKQEL